jgi:hypothetical protein
MCTQCGHASLWHAARERIDRRRRSVSRSPSPDPAVVEEINQRRAVIASTRGALVARLEVEYAQGEQAREKARLKQEKQDRIKWQSEQESLGQAKLERTRRAWEKNRKEEDRKWELVCSSSPHLLEMFMVSQLPANNNRVSRMTSASTRRKNGKRPWHDRR